MWERLRLGVGLLPISPDTQSLNTATHAVFGHYKMVTVVWMEADVNLVI